MIYIPYYLIKALIQACLFFFYGKIGNGMDLGTLAMSNILIISAETTNKRNKLDVIVFIRCLLATYALFPHNL
jgi:hypothetical protein